MWVLFETIVVILMWKESPLGSIYDGLFQAEEAFWLHLEGKIKYQFLCLIKRDNYPLRVRQSAAQRVDVLNSSLWLPEILRSGVPTVTGGLLSTSQRGFQGNWKPSMQSSFESVCVCVEGVSVCVSVCAMSSTEQFYGSLKLHWTNKQPGKSPLFLEWTLFPCVCKQAACETGREERQAGDGEGVGLS